MERTKYILMTALSLSLALSLPAFAQESYRQTTYEAYISGEMERWKPVIAAMEEENDTNVERRLELLEYYYGYIGYLLAEGRKDEAKVYISKGERLIDDILEANPANPDATAYKGSFIAYRFSINRLKAVVSGMESKRLIEKAYSEAPENVRAISEMANLCYYAPALFGRDRARGVRLYEKAARSMEETRADRANWFYLRLLTNIALHYDAVGDASKAAAAYEKILSAEPGYLWVKEELYPDFLARNGRR